MTIITAALFISIGALAGIVAGVAIGSYHARRDLVEAHREAVRWCQNEIHRLKTENARLGELAGKQGEA